MPTSIVTFPNMKTDDLHPIFEAPPNSGISLQYMDYMRWRGKKSGSSAEVVMNWTCLEISNSMI